MSSSFNNGLAKFKQDTSTGHEDDHKCKQFYERSAPLGGLDPGDMDTVIGFNAVRREYTCPGLKQAFSIHGMLAAAEAGGAGIYAKSKEQSVSSSIGVSDGKLIKSRQNTFDETHPLGSTVHYTVPLSTPSSLTRSAF